MTLEQQRVDVLGAREEPVALGVGDEDLRRLACCASGLEHLTEPEDVRLEGRRAVGGVVAPHRVDDLGRRHATVHVEQQSRQDHLGTASPQRLLLTVDLDDEHAEVADPHVLSTSHRGTDAAYFTPRRPGAGLLPGRV